MNELAGQSLGGYELEEEIGRGSMGMVYRGKQIALGREVAIKVLPRSLAKDASYVARFIREAQIVARLNHPHIVQIYDAGQENGLLYFVMEYIQGPTIGNLLHLDGPIPQHIAAEYAAQIAEALDAAYRELNVIHRDIKPENLMLDRWGNMKVMDFGLARAAGHQKITVVKKLIGSLYYASPEQIWGQELDNRSDIYALGVVLYEMVTGKRPFTARSLSGLSEAIISAPLQPPSALNSELAPGLERVILKAMVRDRNRRYEHAALLAQDLRALDLGKHAPTTLQTPLSPIPAYQGRVVQPPKRPQVQQRLPPDPPASEPPTEPLPDIQDAGPDVSMLKTVKQKASPAGPDPATLSTIKQKAVGAPEIDAADTVKQETIQKEKRRSLLRNLRRLLDHS